VEPGTRQDETPRERTITVNWAKGGALMRVQMEGERTYVVLNRDSDRMMMMVLLDEHAYVDQPFDPRRQIGCSAPTDVPMVRGDSDVVTGNSCTLWNAKLGFGNSSLTSPATASCSARRATTSTTAVTLRRPR
jgi:hypothetical protein